MRADWRREWEAELEHQEEQSTPWRKRHQTRWLLMRQSLGSTLGRARRFSVADSRTISYRMCVTASALRRDRQDWHWRRAPPSPWGSGARLQRSSLARCRAAAAVAVPGTRIGWSSFGPISASISSAPAFRRLVERDFGLDHLTAAEAHDFVAEFAGHAVLVKGHRVTHGALALLGLDGPSVPRSGARFWNPSSTRRASPFSSSAIGCGRRGSGRRWTSLAEASPWMAIPRASSVCFLLISSSFRAPICSPH